jgi:hypothetical protein
MFYDKVIAIKQKKHIAESVHSLGITLKSFVKAYQKTKEEQRFDYLH